MIPHKKWQSTSAKKQYHIRHWCSRPKKFQKCQVLSTSMTLFQVQSASKAAQMIAASFFFLLATLTIYSRHRYFITIVKSESMWPTLSKGDVLISIAPTNIKVTDIVIAEVKVKYFRAILRNKPSQLTQPFTSEKERNNLSPRCQDQK